jgi:hypothetical protein
LIPIKTGWSSLVTGRRFPPPWAVEELDACFVVGDGTKTVNGSPSASHDHQMKNMRLGQARGKI